MTHASSIDDCVSTATLPPTQVVAQGPAHRRRLPMAGGAAGLTVLIGLPILLLQIPLLLTATGIPLFGDLQFPLTFSRYVADFATMWNPHGSQSNVQEIDRLLFIDPLLAALRFIGYDTIPDLARVLLIGIPWLSGITMFWLARRILVPGDVRSWRIIYQAPRGSRVGIVSLCLAAAWLYEIGPWVMYQESAYFYLLSYAVAPLVVVLALDLQYGSKHFLARSLTLGTVLAVASTSPQYTVFLGLLTATLLIYRIREHGLTSQLKAAGLVLATYLSLSAYWLVPTILLLKRNGISPGYVLSWGDTVLFSSNASFLNVLTGYSQWNVWWHFPAWWSHSIDIAWRISTVLLPLAAGCAVIALVRTTRAVRWLAVCWIVLIFGSMAARSPLSGIYHYLQFGAPLLSNIGWFTRDPWKLECFTLFAELLLALFAGRAYLGWNGRVRQRRAAQPGGPGRLNVAAQLLPALVLLLVTVSTLPENVYGFYFAYRPVTPPKSYLQAAAYLQRHHGVTLWLAAYKAAVGGGAGTVQYTWSRGREAPFFAAQSMPGTVFGDYHFTNVFAKEYSFLYRDRVDLVPKLQQLGISHVVLANDLVGANRAAGKLAALFARQAGAHLVHSYGSLKIYAISGTRTLPERPAVVVLGGRAGLDKLLALRLLQPHQAVVYAEQTLGANAASFAGPLRTAPIQMVDQTWFDYVVSDILAHPRWGGSVVPVIGGTNGNSDIFSGWQATQMADPTTGRAPWNDYVEEYAHQLDAWDFGYGLGAVTTVHPGAIDRISLRVRPGRYEVFARELVGPHVGSWALAIGHQQFPGRSHGAALTGVHWIPLGKLSIQHAIKSARLIARGGAVAVNAIALIRSDRWSALAVRARQGLARRPSTVVGSCSGNSAWAGGVYLPPGRLRIAAPGVRSLILRSSDGRTRRLPVGPRVVMAGGSYRIAGLAGYCRGAVAFVHSSSSSRGDRVPLVSVREEGWDGLWVCTSRGQAVTPALPIDGVLNGCVPDGRTAVLPQYYPNSALHIGLVASEVAVGVFALLLVLWSRRRAFRGIVRST